MPRPKNGEFRNCTECGKPNWVNRKRLSQSWHFCNRGCESKFKTGRKHTPEQKEQIRNTLRKIWAEHPEWKETVSKQHRGITRSLEARLRIQAGAKKGQENHAWRGGITPLNKMRHKDFEYRLWREQIFKRDDFRCFDCGERGGRLEAHHILPWSLFPRLRLDLLNGITLCKECHRKTPDYGWRAVHLQKQKQEV